MILKQRWQIYYFKNAVSKKIVDLNLWENKICKIEDLILILQIKKYLKIYGIFISLTKQMMRKNFNENIYLKDA